MRDPGNVGTVLRAALSFGAGSVVIGPGCADPYGPKAVRASMGAIFSVPLARATAIADLPGERWRSSCARAIRCRCPGGATIVVGAERAGLDRRDGRAVHRAAHIPIAERLPERRDGRDRRPVRVH